MPTHCCVVQVFADLLFTVCVYANGSAFAVHWDPDAGALVGHRGVQLGHQCTDRSRSFFCWHFVLSTEPQRTGPADPLRIQRAAHRR